jgi:hypothetical protein
MTRTKKEIETLFNIYKRMEHLPFLDYELELVLTLFYEIHEEEKETS